MKDGTMPSSGSHRTPCRTDRRDARRDARGSSRGAGGKASLRARRREHGVSLIIAMVMLVIIGLMSVAVLRNANSADQIATGNRLQTQANQYAQIALRSCESQITLADSAPGKRAIYPADTPEAWTFKANWLPNGGGTKPAYQLQAGDLGGVAGAVPPKLPQCLVEEVNDGSGGTGKVYRVTARGFSPDYTADSNAATVTGSVVWLQSTVYASTGS